MKQQLTITIACLLTFLKGYAQTPTWSNGVACIIYTHCSNCHNPNGIAPFSLLNYQDAVDNKFAIVSAITKGTMPPYPADRTYQHYVKERYLTQDEIKAITQWVNTGAPAGDTSQAPSKPVFNQANEIANPDFTAGIVPYTVPAISSDLYRCFVISNPFTVDRFISGIEVIPGNRSAVHHVLIFQDTSKTPLNLDAADPNPGYTSFGGIGSNTAKLITGWVPGSQASFFPSTMAIRITAGSRIIVQIHYPVSSAGKLDSTKVNLKFNPNSGLRDIVVLPILNHSTTLTDGPLFIPANTIKTFHAKYVVPFPATILTIGPHAHLICESMRSYAVKPGNDTIPIIKIDDWDFHWQGGYSFRKPLYLPAGTTLYGEATYNNTASNPDNPNSPPLNVSLGEATTNEMMLFYFNFLFYQSGDENMIIDTASTIPMYNNCTFVHENTSGIIENSREQTVSIYPNPVASHLQLQMPFMPERAKAGIYDMKGCLQMEMEVKAGSNTLDVESLTPGLYLIYIHQPDGGFKSVKFIKQ